MIFSSLTYLAFFSTVLAVLGLVRSARFKRWFLLAASYFFYGWWDWRFTGLLAGMTLLNYLGAKWIHRQPDKARAKRALTEVIVADVAILGFFKYYGFFVLPANRLLGSFGIEIPLLAIVLPVAISFVTFEVISYVVDVYRGDLEPASLFSVSMLVAFFPHLIAGPILKPQLFLPQVERDIRISRAELSAGAQMFMLGLVMKVLVADRLAMFVDPVLNRPWPFSSATLWLAVLAYSIQIYADFAGYSLMAIGSARAMGFDIPPNFAAPYSARNITVFWRRWHISLSTWLREYLYFPLGGNRKGKLRQAANLMIVMLVAGLWHGASWNFVLWGALHGMALVTHKVWTDRVAPRLRLPSSLSSVVSWLMTFGFVTLAWVLFRITDISAALGVLGRMFGFGPMVGVAWYATSALLLVPVVLIANVLYVRLGDTLPVLKLASFKGAFVFGSAVIALALFWPTMATPFIYFQF